MSLARPASPPPETHRPLASSGGPERGPEARRVVVRSIAGEERAALLAWLDAGLRPGRPGRLEAELPVELSPESAADHVVATSEGRLLAHAFGRLVNAHARGIHVPVGLIGLVYTDPEARGRGLASRCVEQCVASLSRRGAMLVALWSDLEDFYARLGFHPGGRDALYVMDRTVCLEARRVLGARLEVGPLEPREVPEVEALHSARAIGAEREAGVLASRLTAPGCTTVVARRDGRPVATATLGRGDDFPDVVHEWAGESAGVLGCLEWLSRSRDALGLLSGPLDAGILRALRSAGAAVHPRPFALLRITDPEALWRRLSVGRTALAARTLRAEGERLVLGHRRARPGPHRLGGEWSMSHPEALDLLFGSGPGPAPPACLTREERSDLEQALPWPLFLWGFDSI
ncbi:MAG: GNAT family N-acetyltransferase [Myxococcota bacterium]